MKGWRRCKNCQFGPIPSGRWCDDCLRAIGKGVLIGLSSAVAALIGVLLAAMGLK